MITTLDGPTHGVACNENHALYQCGNVVFSATMMGAGLSCHFASTREGLREVKPAIDEFCAWAFKVFGCKVIFAMIAKQSVVRVVKKCGFSHLLDCDEGVIYARYHDRNI